MANSVDLDEVALYEPPHQDLCCLQIQLFSSLVFKGLIFEDFRIECTSSIKFYASLRLWLLNPDSNSEYN